MSERVTVIVNPEAGRGRGGKMIPRVASAFGQVGVSDIHYTASAGDEYRLTRDAIANGTTTIVVVGGDGTTTHVANEIIGSGADVRLAIIPAGTGNDFAKVLGTDKADPLIVAQKSIVNSQTRVDVGKIENRYFLNCCGFGFDVAVLEGISRNRRLRGNAVYLYTALRQIFGYRGFDVQVGRGFSTKHMLLVLANTEYFGGMFRIAPGSRVDDGELDLIEILDIPTVRRVPILSAATKGDHMKYPECLMDRARSFDLSFPEPPAYEADGELHRAASANLTVSSCPSALRVLSASD
jgi:diacylglycerol kinase (ATP)